MNPGILPSGRLADPSRNRQLRELPVFYSNPLGARTPPVLNRAVKPEPMQAKAVAGSGQFLRREQRNSTSTPAALTRKGRWGTRQSCKDSLNNRPERFERLQPVVAVPLREGDDLSRFKVRSHARNLAWDHENHVPEVRERAS